ncbi:hypothetical protein BGZ79_010798 [Entomortierella chlamydospora]|nr:hypothetical protein BGZ79_010798 [Entomortierella chlamydospora]
MGNSVSSLYYTNRKSSTQSLGVPKGSDGRKPSIFQRSKNSLQFRKRAKSSSVSDNSGSSGSNQMVTSRNHSLDSFDGNSVCSRNSCGNSNESQHQKHKNVSRHPHQRDSSTTNSSSSYPSGTLPDWAYHSRKCDDGRTRHTVENAPYMLPNDLTESDRLDAQHYLVRFLLKGNHNVDLDPEANLKILDVATGTGVWALEMAHEFPKADIYGVDISAIFPTEIKPSNCHFQLCNILDGLPFPDNYFDFIYQRLLVYALTPEQRKQVYVELQRVLKPEGYLQLVESDGIVYNAGPEVEMINNLSLETSLRHGVDPRDVQNMKAGLKGTGYTGVNSFHVALPVGNWGGKVGALSLQNMHGLATIWLKGEVGKLDQEACDARLAIVDREIEQYKPYYKVWLVVGQKPSVAAAQLREARKAAVSLANSSAQTSYPSPETTAPPRRF